MSMQGGDEMELGKQIKMHRQEAHLSQEEFGIYFLLFFKRVVLGVCKK